MRTRTRRGGKAIAYAARIWGEGLLKIWTLMRTYMRTYFLGSPFEHYCFFCTLNFSCIERQYIIKSISHLINVFSELWELRTES